MRLLLTNRFRVWHLAALLAALVCRPAAAGHSAWLDPCKNFFNFISGSPAKNTKSQRILVAGGGPSAPDMAKKFIGEANELLSAFAIPPKVEIQFIDGEKGAYFMGPSTKIEMPTSFSGDESAIQRTFLQHEYGHAVFYENLGDYFPEWRAWVEDATDRRPTLAPEAPTPAELDNISFAYQELFADLLTVTTQNDPDAIVRAVGQQFSAGDGKLVVRSFSGDAFDSRWTEFKAVYGEHGPIYGADPTTAPPERVRPLTDPHHAFAPVRAHLWQNFFSRPELYERRPEMLKAVFDTIAREIGDRMKDKSLRAMPFSTMSARLLRALDHTLAPYKLK